MKLTGNPSSELLFHLYTNFKQSIVSLYLPLASKNFGLSGNLVNKHANNILGKAQNTVNKFHDLNKTYSFSISIVSGIITHATPETNSN